MLNTRPVETKELSWDLNFNFSRNRNKVVRLTPENNNFELAAANWKGVIVAAVEGENYGAIMGRDYKRNEQGEILINPENGFPLVSDKLEVLGNASWDWTGGLSTSLRYKNFTLSGIIDVKVGADLFSVTSATMYENGKSIKTLAGRDEWYKSEEGRLAAGTLPANWTPTGGYVAEGVIEQPDGTYKRNEIIVDPQEYWNHVTNFIATPFVYDNSYVKVRELSLTYNFPKKLTYKFADAVSFSIISRNPFILYKNVDNIDPDSNFNNGAAMGLEYGSLPSRRSFGINLNVKF